MNANDGKMMTTPALRSSNTRSPMNSFGAAETSRSLPIGYTLVALASLMALMLNHSSRIAGFNMSLADPLLVVTLFALMLAGRLVVPTFALLFLSAIVIVSIGAVTISTPILFGVFPSGAAYFGDLLKLIVCFCFFVAGVSLSELGLNRRAVAWFAMGATVVAILGIVMEFTGVRVLGSVLYYGDLRFRGFMADPNYWSVLAVAATAFFMRASWVRWPLRIACIASLVGSVVLSASKTGIIVLLLLLALHVLDRVYASRSRIVAIGFLSMCVAAILLIWGPLLAWLERIVADASTSIPQLNRVSILLKDPLGAINEGGSSRGDIWDSGLEMIGAAPFQGVGLGAFRSINESLIGMPAVAHNTYLQIGAEWGLPLALAFLLWTAYLIVVAGNVNRDSAISADTLTMRDIIVVFLVGSLSLSLNNARMFWLFLGITYVLVRRMRMTGLSPTSKSVLS